ncbi:LacI family DNA-binding transcriptional regulator [Georgenia wangjunii]|uniref:LacI family DNA-binding transcriptional regulator n=1 Tax=Georgenia wangjunii TaxID=3117730 RepID=UPI002F2628BE
MAAEAGVARATVSKYLADGSRNYYVAESTRERIASAIERLGYEPNAVARSLSNSRSYTIGVIVPSITNPFYPGLIAGIEDVAGAEGFTVILGSTEGSLEREERIVSSLRQRQVDGIVLASQQVEDGVVERLVESGLDVVLASRPASSLMTDTVMADDMGGTHAAMEHLLEHGHERIGHIAGPAGVATFRNRAEAFRASCHEHGAGRNATPVVVQAESATVEGGARAAEELLASPGVTAVFAANDLIAMGVLSYCASIGRRVPEDLAVVGFDNVWVSRMPGIDLTTVDGKTREVGRMAAERVVERIRDRWAPVQSAPEPQAITLSTELVRRRTCGCLTA